MTAPRGTGGAGVWIPRLLVLVPGALVLVTSALTPASELFGFGNQGDVGLYYRNAVAIFEGLVPYRDFALEYPPLAILPMVVPYLLWPGGAPTDVEYAWMFAAWEAALVVVVGFVLLRLARLDAGADARVAGAAAAQGSEATTRRRISAALRLIVLTAGAALAITWRLDMFPALLVLVAVWASAARRPALAGFAVGLAILAKLYPLALVPALAIPWLVPLSVTRVIRFGLAAALTVLVVQLPFVALAGSEAFYYLGYQAARGLQIESVAGGLVMLQGLVAGQPMVPTFEYSAVQASGPLATAFLAMLPIATAVGFAALGWLGLRRIRSEGQFGPVRNATLVQLATASLLMLIVTSKVFSIQYVVWIVPFAALLHGRQFWLAAVLLALTMPIHPLFYADLVNQAPLPILVLNLRNALVVALLGSVLWNVARPAGLEPTTFRSAT